jgi:copper resistance protein B
MTIRLPVIIAGAVLPAMLALPAVAQTMSDNPAQHEPPAWLVLLDQLEYRVQDGANAVAWDGQGYYGGDYERIWFKTEGEYSTGREEFEKAEVQLLYSRLVGYYWNAQAGLRYDFEPDPSRTYGVIGLQGLAPGFFEVDTQGFVSDEGDFSARLKADYDILVTQRLILQPKAELNLAAQDVPELGIGSGFNDLELGLRLRYEIAREFAPYVGISWERKLGETAQMVRREGEDVDVFAVLAGIRFWF